VSTLPMAARADPSVNNRTVALLQCHPLFCELDPEHLKQLCSYARTRRILSGTTLFVKGDPGNALYVVASGIVKITVASIDGPEAILNLLYTGEIFGEIALLDGKPRTADALAFTDCELIMIERRDFLSFVDGDPKVAMKLIELLCAKLRTAANDMEEVLFLDLAARLARLLTRLVKQNTASDKALLRTTQLEISQMLGASRESVNKQLQIWTKRKLIALRRGAILVLAPQALAALVGRDDCDDEG
jgi:CRP/FNR family transcriptional regulator, cyclic AMP receptor protein